MRNIILKTKLEIQRVGKAMCAHGDVTYFFLNISSIKLNFDFQTQNVHSHKPLTNLQRQKYSLKLLKIINKCRDLKERTDPISDSDPLSDPYGEGILEEVFRPPLEPENRYSDQ